MLFPISIKSSRHWRAADKNQAILFFRLFTEKVSTLRGYFPCFAPFFSFQQGDLFLLFLWEFSGEWKEGGCTHGAIARELYVYQVFAGVLGEIHRT